MREEWKPIPGYEHYLVSNYGRVFNQKPGRRPKILHPSSGKNGYLVVVLYKDGQAKGYQIHRLVLLLFKGEAPSSEHQVNHVDLNKRNNRVDNLEWVTRLENMHHYYERVL